MVQPESGEIFVYILNYLTGAVNMLVYKKEIHGFDLHKMKVGISIEFLKDT